MHTHVNSVQSDQINRTLPYIRGATEQSTMNSMPRRTRARTTAPLQTPPAAPPPPPYHQQHHRRQLPPAVRFLIAAIFLLVASQYLLSVLVVTEKPQQHQQQQQPPEGIGVPAHIDIPIISGSLLKDDSADPVAAADELANKELRRKQRKQIQKQRPPKPKPPPAVPVAPKNELLYVGTFGLGHRLSKLSSAYHLAVAVAHGMLDVDANANVDAAGKNNRNTSSSETASAAATVPTIDVLKVHWGSCQGNDIRIFAHLFGSSFIQIPITRETASATGTDRAVEIATSTDEAERRQQQQRRQLSKTVLVRNDVLGYYAGQAYKNAGILIPLNYTLDDGNGNSNINSSGTATSWRSPWFQKMDSDVTFFRHLCDNFRGRKSVRDFQADSGWHNHTVIGLHIRAGNGEQYHFAKADRGISNTTVYVQRVVQLLEQFIAEQKYQHASDTPSSSPAPPLIFLATDQADLIPVIQDLTRQFGVETISFPQSRLSKDQGVSYQTLRKGRPCLDGWMTSMSDMFLLAEADMLVAGMRSTFTQILPLSLIFARDRNNNSSISNKMSMATTRAKTTPWKFCEADGYSLSCFRDRQAWVFRQDTAVHQDRIRTIRLDHDTTGSSNGGGDDQHQTVVHKVMVHLPDVELEPALQGMRTFLLDDDANKTTATAGDNNNDDKYVPTFPYGGRINPKYRKVNGKKPVFREDWTWTDP